MVYTPEQQEAIARWEQDNTSFYTDMSKLAGAGQLSADDAWATTQQFYDQRNSLSQPDAHAGAQALGTQGILDLTTQYLTENRDNVGYDGVEDWYYNAHQLYAHNPTEFMQWAQENPEMATRFHAQANVRGNTNDVNWGDNPLDHNQMAAYYSQQLAQDAGYGDDFKQDGRAYAYDYNTFNDVNSEYGAGDFWKIGTPQKFSGGLMDYIEDNPWKAAGTLAALVAAPYAGAAVGGGLAGAATGGAVAGGGSQLAQGGDFSDVFQGGLLGAAVGAGGSLLGSWADGAQTLSDYAQGSGSLGDLSFMDRLALADPTAAVGQFPGAIQEDYRDEQGNYTDVLPDSILDALSDWGGWHPSRGGSTGAESGGSGQAQGETDWIYEGNGVFKNPQTGETVTEDVDSANDPYVVGDEYSRGGPVQDAPTGPSGAAGGTPNNLLDILRGLLGNGSGDGGDGSGSGSGSGNGSGDGEGDGTAEERGEFPIELLGLLAPLLGQMQEDDLDYRKPRRYGEVRYERPTYDDVEQRALLTPQRLGPSAPSITPASNSGQADFNEWFKNYLRQQQKAEGVLSGITGGGLI
jgi:hypothetical protein